MGHSKSASPLIIGLALFSMFFGSGNLIFPLFVGQLAKQSWFTAFFGFWLTAVALPFCGVIAMVFYRGNYFKFFSQLGPQWGFFLPLALLTVWIPLGSAPRCITLAYAALVPYIELPSLALFSIAYSLIVWAVTFRQKYILNVLGYLLTPLLLLCLATVVIKGSVSTSHLEPSSYLESNLFWISLQEGYNTMDLIAAFFFSASIIALLKENDPHGSHHLRLTLHSCLVGMALLSIVYLGLIYLAASQTDSLKELAKDQLLASLAKNILGAKLGLIAALAIILACLSTSIALALVYAEFISEHLFKKKAPQPALLITLSASSLMSILGLQGITAITAPLLSIFYPLLLLLIGWSVGKRIFARNQLL